jgi:hypothetical protein
VSVYPAVLGKFGPVLPSGEARLLYPVFGPYFLREFRSGDSVQSG